MKFVFSFILLVCYSLALDIYPTDDTYDIPSLCSSGQCVYYDTKKELVSAQGENFIGQTVYTDIWIKFSTSTIPAGVTAASLTLTGCQSGCGCEGDYPDGAPSGYELTVYNASTSWIQSTLTGSTTACNVGCAALPTIGSSAGTATTSSSGILTQSVTNIVQAAYTTGSYFAVVIRTVTLGDESAFCSTRAESAYRPFVSVSCTGC